MLIAWGGVNAQSTHSITAGKSTEYGLVYTLPATAFDITVETRHTIRKPGEFRNYAGQYLNLSDVIRDESCQVVIESVNINMRGIPDPSNRWIAQFKTGSTPTMTLTHNEVPLSINCDAVSAPAAPLLPVAQKANPTPLEGDAARQAVTEEMSRANTPGKKAQLAARRIFELREQRNDIISGNAENTPPDGRAMELTLASLAAQENALTAMFAGTTQTFTNVRTFTFVPDSNAVSSMLLTRISPLDGFTAAEDLSGIPLYLDYEPLSDGKFPVNEKGEPKKFPKGGVAYTIPGTGKITLNFQGNVIADCTADIAQNGIVFGLDPAMFTDKKAPAYVIFSPTTGAVIKLGETSAQ